VGEDNAASGVPNQVCAHDEGLQMTTESRETAPVAIVDYGMGNLRSVEKAFQHIGVSAAITADPDRIAQARALAVPGVGAFAKAMDNLRAGALIEPVKQAIEGGKPFLGICLGLQILFDESEEFGPVAGLGVLPGRVVRFPADPALKVPHMGWNAVEPQSAAPPLAGLPPRSMFYFVHSYYVAPDQTDVVAATTDHGVTFTSAVWRDNVFASQFHPEKSGAAGLALLDRFAQWAGVRS
jgi:glutamine amidotransferase